MSEPTIMKERPILFSGPMVRALLAGTKTQTRRVQGFDEINKNPGDYLFLGVRDFQGQPHAFFRQISTGIQILVKCPYGQPGDRLWVRETWRADEDHDGPFIYYATDGARDYGLIELSAGMANPYINGKETCRPSIHMPRWASRIILEIESVRVERLQDISEDDAKAEGIGRHKKNGVEWFDLYPTADDYPGATNVPTMSYRTLWEDINGTGSWDANPWVWVVQFKRA